MENLTVEVLVVGGGTGGTAAALQAARRGAKTLLVSEFPWLGGMLTSAGVVAPDGNELEAWQTGIWGAYLQQLRQRQPGGLDHGWVSFFTYDPRVGAQIFQDWVDELPNLQWIAGQVPLEVLRQADRVTGVRFPDFTVYAQIVLDGTELGDLLALGDIPHRWGWELQAEFGEPSAPIAPNLLTQTYPVQAPTWVVILQDFGTDNPAPLIPAPPHEQSDRFTGAWDNYGCEKFLNYGRLPGNRFMINWPIRGNDYGEGVQRLIGSPEERSQFLQAARWYTQSFARYIQTHLGQRYGLATDIFPILPEIQSPKSKIQNSLGGGAYALHPYYRESRRLQGLTTIREQDLLPIAKGQVAALPIAVSAAGCLQASNRCDAIAIGNYANDHHYPSGDIHLQPKSIRWGGRWTGTPFTIPYRALIPAAIDGLLACEKNISVSHIANGATRLQPVVLGIGQAAGMAAALCVEQGCQPRELNVRSLQEALLQDPIAAAALIPLFNLEPDHPDWLYWQTYYLDHPENYPASGYCPDKPVTSRNTSNTGTLQSRQQSIRSQQKLTGTFTRQSTQDYLLTVHEPVELQGQRFAIVTLRSEINQALENLQNGQTIAITGMLNRSGEWILASAIQPD
ncbi:MAG: FAD-dependent oxidoreductase [Leptolyngbyaceae cyanobacterium]